MTAASTSAAPGRGIAYTILGGALLTTNDAVLKWLTGDYPVGYCRPPKAHQFPKKTSGNPGGAPKKKKQKQDKNQKKKQRRKKTRRRKMKNQL